MSKQADYTADEWKTLMTAPVAAGLLVSLSDVSGPIGLVKESFAVFKGVSEVEGASANELIKAIADGLKHQTSRPELSSVKQDSPESVRSSVIDLCKQAVAIVRQKSPDEADEYARWLVSLAQKTAEASKEGGFLGFGGTLISDAESAAIKELAAALGA